MQICCVVLLVANMGVLTFLIVSLWQQKLRNPTTFTKAMVAIIAIAILLASSMYLLVIMATRDVTVKLDGSVLIPSNPKAFQFVFGKCWLGLSWLNAVQSYLSWLALMILVSKYHTTARQIRSVIKTGSLLPDSQLRRGRLIFLTLVVVVGLYYASLEVCKTIFTNHFFYRHLEKLEHWAFYLHIIVIIIPLLSFANVYKMLYSSDDRKRDFTKVNIKMLITNIVLLTVNLLADLWFLARLLFDSSEVNLATVLILSTVFSCNLAIKVLLLGFLNSFGQQLTVKSTILQSGQLAVVGIDQRGEEVFSIRMRGQLNRSQMLADGSEMDLENYEDLLDAQPMNAKMFDSRNSQILLIASKLLDIDSSENRSLKWAGLERDDSFLAQQNNQKNKIE